MKRRTKQNILAVLTDKLQQLRLIVDLCLMGNDVATGAIRAVTLQAAVIHDIAADEVQVLCLSTSYINISGLAIIQRHLCSLQAAVNILIVEKSIITLYNKPTITSDSW